MVHFQKNSTSAYTAVAAEIGMVTLSLISNDNDSTSIPATHPTIESVGSVKKEHTKNAVTIPVKVPSNDFEEL